ncbi:MAG: transposase [Candidatus Bathyarchaeia archaeon]
MDTIPDWQALLRNKIFCEEIGSIMGIDTTVLKIGGKPYTYLHISDIPGKLPLAYMIRPTRTIDDIAPILTQLIHWGYKPKLIVCDLAPELLSVCGRVFPSVPVQGCIFHLRYWLDKELPTKRKKQTPTLLKNWLFLKKKIMQAALASTSEQQDKLLEKLLDLRLDETAKKVVRLFLENIQYYHPANELEKYGWRTAYSYNNVCERAMQSVKAIGKRMRGFKKPETAAKYINAFWYYDFLSKNRCVEDKKSVEDKIREIDIPLLLYADNDEPINIKQLVEVTKIDYDLLEAYLEKIRNMVVTSNYALSKKCVEKLRLQLVNLKKNTIGEAAKVTGLDISTLIELLPKIGLKIVYRTIDVNEAKIVLISPILNRL